MAEKEFPVYVQGNSVSLTEVLFLAILILSSLF